MSSHSLPIFSPGSLQTLQGQKTNKQTVGLIQNSMSSILKMPLSIHVPSQNLSFSKTLLSPTPLFLNTKLSTLSIHNPTRSNTTLICMGGGPRTFPGGVSKWQWKRMQAKKAKQLLQARLTRERNIYEMRKRAELKAAVSELERSWEAVEKAPNLFSVKADEQVKVLADRFQKQGGFDMWSDRDGPQLFDDGVVDDLPSARFFPKGVVHSVKPYLGSKEGGEKSNLLSENKGQEGNKSEDGKKNGVRWRRKGNRGSFGNSDGKISNLKNEVNDKRRILKSESFDKTSDSKSEVYDIRLQRDGSYGINKKK